MLKGQTQTKTRTLLSPDCPKKFVCPTISLRTKGVFRGSFSPRAQNTIPEQANTERTVVGACRGLLSLQHESGPEFYQKLARILSRILSRNRPEFFSPFFPAPKNPRQIHATFGAKIHANFGNFFLSGFSGCSTLVCVAAFGCQYFYADQRRLVS